MILINRQVRNPGIVRVRRIADRDVIAVFRKEHRHQPEQLVLLLRQRFIRPFINLPRRILITAEQAGSPVVRRVAVGKHVRVADKAGELLLQLRLLLKDIRHEAAACPVKHQDHDVFPLPVQVDNLFPLILLLFREPSDLRQAVRDGNDIHQRHAAGYQGRQDADRPEQGSSPAPEEKDGTRQCQEYPGVQQDLHNGNPARDVQVIDKAGGHIAVTVPEEHIVYNRRKRQYRENQAESRAVFFLRQESIDDAPDHEGAGGKQECVQHKDQRRAVGIDLHKFLRGVMDHRGRDQQAREHRQQHTAGKEDSPTVLPDAGRYDSGLSGLSGPFCFPDQHGQSVQKQRNLQRQHQADKPENFPGIIILEPERDEHPGREPEHGAGDPGVSERIPELSVYIFDKGKEVVHRPVDHEARRGIVQ